MLLNLYTCKEALQRLNDYLDRELTTQEIDRVRFHLRICHECSRKFSFDERFNEDLRDKLHHIEMPANLLSRISQSIMEGLEETTEEDL